MILNRWPAAQRHCRLVFMISSSLLWVFATRAEEGQLNAITLPDGPIPVESALKDDPDARKAFQDMVRGEPGAIASDPIMGEIMRVYRSNGSVLDDSLSDAQFDTPLHLESDSLKRAPPPSGPFQQGQEHGQYARQRLLAAELLLKTSRIIDKIKPLSENQRELVIQMRQEAVNIMAGSSQRPMQAIAVPTTEPKLPSCIKTQ